MGSSNTQHRCGPLGIPPGPRRILLVDDQVFFLTLARDLLTPAGYEVETAANGGEALALARASRPDAILLDLEMPGMDGYETCRQLKADPAVAGIPVVILTASLDSKLKERAVEAGAAATFIKALTPERLRSILRAALAAAPAGPGHGPVDGGG